MQVVASPPSAQTTKQEVNLDDVKKSFETQSIPLFQRGWSDTLKSTLLTAGLFALLQFFLLGALTEQAAVQSVVSQRTIQLGIKSSATPAQANTFLQALLSLPYVENVRFVTREQLLAAERDLAPENVALLAGANPFTDRAEVLLSSFADENVFYSFLKHKELSPVLDGASLLAFPDWISARENAITLHQAARDLLLIFAALITGMLCLTLFHSLKSRIQSNRGQVRSLLLLGMEQLPLRFALLKEEAKLMSSAFCFGLTLSFFFLLPQLHLVHVSTVLFVVLVQVILFAMLLTLLCFRLTLSPAHGTDSHL